jgi:hypothetical protein
VLIASMLAEHRPSDDMSRLNKMLQRRSWLRHATIKSRSAYRAITDYLYCCYLSDLAVAVRGRGHGHELQRLG